MPSSGQDVAIAFAKCGYLHKVAQDQSRQNLLWMGEGFMRLYP